MLPVERKLRNPIDRTIWYSHTDDLLLLGAGNDHWGGCPPFALERKLGQRQVREK
jgi:hypothetical protein